MGTKYCPVPWWQGGFGSSWVEFSWGCGHRRPQGSRAVPGQQRAQTETPPWAEGRALGAPGRAGVGTAPGAPVLPGKGCCGSLQPGGCKNLPGGFGVSATPPAQPLLLLFCSTAHLVLVLYRRRQQQDPAEPLFLQLRVLSSRPCSQSSLQGSKPWSPGRSGRALAAPQGCTPSTQSQY